MIELVKYPNRKLYLPKTGYVTQKFLLEEFKKGSKVVVIDKTTKADVTNQVLKSAILDNVELSTETLVGLINGQENQVQG